MTQPVRIESGTDAGTVVGDTDDERAAPAVFVMQAISSARYSAAF